MALDVRTMDRKPKVEIPEMISTVTGYNDALVWGPLLISIASSGAVPPAIAMQLRMGGVSAIVSGGLRAMLGTRDILDASDTGIADQPPRLRVNAVPLDFAGFYR